MFPLMLFVPVLITIVILFVWIFLGIRHRSGRYVLGVLPFIAVWAGFDIMAFFPKRYALNTAPFIYPVVAFGLTLVIALIAVGVITARRKQASSPDPDQSKSMVVFSRWEQVGLQVFLVISYTAITIPNQIMEYRDSFMFTLRHTIESNLIASGAGLFFLLLLSLAFPRRTTLFGQGTARHDFWAEGVLFIWAGLGTFIFWLVFMLFSFVMNFGP